MGVVLWHIELSHYNEKARWALDYKGVEYERRVPMPGLHGIVALVATRGAQRRLPVIELDGRRIGDSTAIIAALEERWPEPPLYPADAADRSRALELEDFFDEHLAPDVRRFGWHHTLADVDGVAASLFTSPNARRERMLRSGFPVAERFMRLDYKIDTDSALRARTAIVAAMDRLEAELGPSGYLVGDVVRRGRSHGRRALHAGAEAAGPAVPPGAAAPARHAGALRRAHGSPGRPMGLRHVLAPPRRLRRGGACTQPLTPPPPRSPSCRATRSA